MEQSWTHTLHSKSAKWCVLVSIMFCWNDTNTSNSRNIEDWISHWKVQFYFIDIMFIMKVSLTKICLNIFIQTMLGLLAKILQYIYFKGRFWCLKRARSQCLEDSFIYALRYIYAVYNAVFGMLESRPKLCNCDEQHIECWSYQQSNCNKFGERTFQCWKY